MGHFEKLRPEQRFQNEHAYVICCWLEVVNDVISSRNVKTPEGYAVVNFEVASFSSFLYFSQKSFCDGEVGGGSGGMSAICSCSSPEVADDVISFDDVDTFRFYACVNLWIVIFSCFRQKSKSTIYAIRRQVLVNWSPIFGVKEQNCLMDY